MRRQADLSWATAFQSSGSQSRQSHQCCYWCDNCLSQLKGNSNLNPKNPYFPFRSSSHYGQRIPPRHCFSVFSHNLPKSMEIVGRLTGHQDSLNDPHWWCMGKCAPTSTSELDHDCDEVLPGESFGGFFLWLHTHAPANQVYVVESLSFSPPKCTKIDFLGVTCRDRFSMYPQHHPINSSYKIISCDPKNSHPIQPFLNEKKSTHRTYI